MIQVAIRKEHLKKLQKSIYSIVGSKYGISNEIKTVNVNLKEITEKNFWVRSWTQSYVRKLILRKFWNQSTFIAYNYRCVLLKLTSWLNNVSRIIELIGTTCGRNARILESPLMLVCKSVKTWNILLKLVYR